MFFDLDKLLNPEGSIYTYLAVLFEIKGHSISPEESLQRIFMMVETVDSSFGFAK